MFDQMSWICSACNVGTSVPKSRATSSYLSPRHFMAASTMSGSWPTILLGSFGSRYMTGGRVGRSEEHTSELQSLRHLVCRLLLEKKKKKRSNMSNVYT